MIIDCPKAYQTQELKSLWICVFKDTEETVEQFWRTAYDPARCRCVTVEGQVVSAFYWLDCSCRGRKLAYLYAGATLPQFRKNGYFSKLIEDTCRHLESLGYHGAVLVPASQSLFGYYAKHGFTPFGGIEEFTCAAGTERLTVQLVDREEYERLRAGMLPEGGVDQPGTTIAYLETQAQFYVGDGFLLAAYPKGTALAGLELLGDVSLAPGIVSSLGFAEGSFRTPGTEREFAMYRAFDGGVTPPPTYFGLALD